MIACMCFSLFVWMIYWFYQRCMNPISSIWSWFFWPWKSYAICITCKLYFMKDHIAFLGMPVGWSGIQVDQKIIEGLQTLVNVNIWIEVRSVIGHRSSFDILFQVYVKSQLVRNLWIKYIGIHKWKLECNEAYEECRIAVTFPPTILKP